MQTKSMLIVLGSVFLGVSMAVAAPQKTQEMQDMQGMEHMQGMSHMQHEHALHVGKKGEIKLTEPTKVADKVLKPNTYVVQHRDAGDQHFVRFLELSKVSNAGRFTYTEKNNAGEIPCKVEPAAKVTRTTVYTETEDRVPRITKVAIKGEDALHVF